MGKKSRKRKNSKYRTSKLGNKNINSLHKAIKAVKENLDYISLFMQSKEQYTSAIDFSEIRLDEEKEISAVNVDWLNKWEQEKKFVFGDILDFDIRYIQTIHNKRRTSKHLPIAFTIKKTIKF